MFSTEQHSWAATSNVPQSRGVVEDAKRNKREYRRGKCWIISQLRNYYNYLFCQNKKKATHGILEIQKSSQRRRFQTGFSLLVRSMEAAD